MRGIFFCFTICLLTLVSSCQSKQEKQTETRFEQVYTLIKGEKLDIALQLLDSIQVWYADDFGVVGRAMQLHDSVALVYHSQFIETASQLLDSLEVQVGPLAKNFRLTPGEAGQPGMYEHKRQRVNNSWDRVFLKFNLTENGEYWITSHYFGEEWIDHYCIKVYHRDLYIFSDTLPLDHPWNRKVQDMNDKWETIDFKEGTDGGVIGFIAEHANLPLKVRFTGKKHYYIVMEGFDKEAIREGLELAQVLSEMNQLRQSIDRHQKALRLLNNRKITKDSTIQQKQNESN